MAIIITNMMLFNGIVMYLFWFGYPEDLSPEGAFIPKKSKQMFKTAIFSLEPLP